jgi:hypothetical protein
LTAAVKFSKKWTNAGIDCGGNFSGVPSFYPISTLKKYGILWQNFKNEARTTEVFMDLNKFQS